MDTIALYLKAGISRAFGVSVDIATTTDTPTINNDLTQFFTAAEFTGRVWHLECNAGDNTARKFIVSNDCAGLATNSTTSGYMASG